MTEPPLDLVGQGREPGPPRSGRALTPAMRRVAMISAGLVVAGAVWLVARPPATRSEQVAHRGGSQSAAATGVPQTIVVDPSPDPLAAAPTHHDLIVSAVATDHTFIAFAGHVLLFLRVTYTGPGAVRVMDGRVPQAGAYPDAGAGGLTAGTTANISLRHGVPAEIFVRTRVNCDAVLTGPAVQHLDVVTQAAGSPPRGQRVDLTDLGPFWDEARQAACRPADPSRDVTVSVTSFGATPRVGKTPASVHGLLSVHNAAGFDAIVAVAAPGPGSAWVTSIAGVGPAGAVVQGGSTYTTGIRWTVRDCAAALAQPAPAVPLEVTISDRHGLVPGQLSGAFAAAFRLTLLQACG